MKTIGQKISPILNEIEDTLWEYEANDGPKPEFTEEGFRSAIKIFMAVMMDKMYSLQSYEDMSLEDRSNMATKCGEDIRKFVKIYTDIDTHNLYK